jgi:UDP-N-acetylmuramate--alanine ligase
MSDYGHHPTEISLTLDALKERNPDKKLFVVFQPHQYSRTLELLD